MIIIQTVSELMLYLQSMRENEKTIGLVPTMGALHQGHLELAKRAMHENDIVVCSIFVNPIQFNNPLDLEKYPRTFEQDAALLEDLGCDVIFAPTVSEMYPRQETKIYDFGALEKVMEGEFRAGHFNGVAIVVKKLFDIVMPHKAYFGEKDFQQLAIIKALVKLEYMSVEIVPCPTVRETDGLAMSSRNVRLNENQRKEAPLIYQTLLKAAKLYRDIQINEIIEWVKHTINANQEMELEYFEIVDVESMQSIIAKDTKQQVVACIAVNMGSVRLIDNLVIN